MSKSSKIMLGVVSGIAGLLVLVGLILPLIVNVDAYKGQIESSASDASGMEISIEGQLKADFFPGLRIMLGQVHVRNHGTDFIVARETQITIDLFSLIRGEIGINKIMLKSPVISIERGQDGTFNVEGPRVTAAAPRTVDLPHISISNGTLRYTDTTSRINFEAVECDSEVRFRASSEQSVHPVGRWPFTWELACAEIRGDALIVSDLQLAASSQAGVLNLDPVTMRMFGAEASASVNADFTANTPVYRVSYSLPQFQIEQFLQTLMPPGTAQGRMDFSAAVSMRGKTVHEMTQTMAGQISLEGQNLTYYGLDLDQTLSRLESSQNFNLVDVGAIVVAGPLGLMVTKGYDFASIFSESGTSSAIGRFVSNWKVENGMSQAIDVAMATDKNRVALSGDLDLVNERFEHIVVAVVDSNGCAKVRQKLHGSFHDPVVDSPNFIEALAGPAVSLFKTGKNFFLGGECEVFYSGSVVAPM